MVWHESDDARTATHAAARDLARDSGLCTHLWTGESLSPASHSTDRAKCPQECLLLCSVVFDNGATGDCAGGGVGDLRGILTRKSMGLDFIGCASAEQGYMEKIYDDHPLY